MVDVSELLKRNRGFAKGADKRKIAELAKGQKPETIVLTCSDSRVAPELIFNCGLGEIFVVRVAGNVACDCDVLASMEYAAEHLGAKNLLVLGHTSCGAINAACHSDGKGHGNINGLICQVLPAVEKTGRQAEKAVEENVRLQLSNIRKGSSVISSLEVKGELKLFGAMYDLATGEVRLL